MLGKKRANDVKDIAAFFVELVSRAREFLTRPLRVHFIAEHIPRRGSGSSDIRDFLPILRTVLFDSSRSIVPNPRTSLHIHTIRTEGSPKDIASRIAGQLKSGDEEFFIITLGKAPARKEIYGVFEKMPAESKKHITLLHLPAETGDTQANTGALVSAMRILINGEPVPLSDSGLRVFQEKI